MNFLPTTLGTRPRLACEIRAEGMVAARAEDASAQLAAVAKASLADGAIAPGLRPGNVANASAAASALRKVLESVALKTREVTLVIPDAAARVLLVDFDSLPGNDTEALSIIRFRLKKLLPFDADEAALSYQVMSTSKTVVRVLAVAMPREVLWEYEALVRETGFEPGAVLPSTLAAIAGLTEGEAPVMIVNAGPQGVTTAIVQNSLVLLHRTIDLAEVGPQLVSSGPIGPIAPNAPLIPLVDRESSAGEWAAQEGAAEAYAKQNAYAKENAYTKEDTYTTLVEAAPPPVLLGQQTFLETAAEVAVGELAQAVSVTAAWFEDNLATPPETLLSAGSLGAQALSQTLAVAGVGPFAVFEMVDQAMLGPAATSTTVPLSWLAGVRGALAS